MSENNKHIKQYTTEDIQAYLDGRMNNAEMHAIEKAALDDPFLADALEGFDSARSEFSEPVVHTNLEEARQLLADRIQQKEPGKVIAFPWKQLAAAAIVIIIAGVWIFNSKEEKASKEIAVTSTPGTTNTNPSSITKSPAEDLARDFDTANAPLTTQTVPKTAIEEKNQPAVSDLSTKVVDDTRELASKDQQSPVSPPSLKIPELNKKESRSSNTERQQTHDFVLDDEAAKSRPQVAKQAPLGRSEADVQKPVFNKSEQQRSAGSIAQSNFFNGKVIDSNDKPVAFATISLLNNKNAFATDQNGNFKFQSMDSVLTVDVTGIGFQRQSFQLRNDLAVNELKLNSDNKSLNEVVVVGYGADKKKESTSYRRKFPKVMVQDAEPVDGWIEFEKYIDSTKKTFPGEGSGEVVVSFGINNKNEISNLKIEQAMSEAQNQEAIRLIKDGPAWRLLRGRKAKVYVIVKF